MQFVTVNCPETLHHLFLACSQFAQSTASAGCELPAADRHADSQNVLLLQPRSSPVSHLSHRDPEDHLQPGDLRQPAGQILIISESFNLNSCVIIRSNNAEKIFHVLFLHVELHNFISISST